MTRRRATRSGALGGWAVIISGCLSACSIHDRSLDTESGGRDGSGAPALPEGGASSQGGAGNPAAGTFHGGTTSAVASTVAGNTHVGEGGSSGTFGSIAWGGGVPTGGVPTGGVPTGGATQLSSATIGNGGAEPTAGTPTSAGTSPVAGVAGIGGTVPTGGTSTTGGTVPTGGTSTTGGVSATGGATNVCRIGQGTYESGKINGSNACQICEPTKNATDWTTLSEGATCEATKYCHNGACETGCWIDTAFLAPGDLSKANVCKSCQPTKTTKDWSNLPDNARCESSNFCVAGTCKPGCVVDSVFSAPGASNPGAACFVCSPARSNVKWSRREGCFKSLAVGGGHACSRLDKGTVWCWGLNDRGQLGDRTTNNSSAPVLVSGLTTATAVAAGAGHSCAVLSDYHVHCWGSNEFGQTGDNSTGTATPAPKAVLNIDSAIAVAAGFSHSCALLSSKTVQCWGNNNFGQLGRGGTENSSIAVLVSGISDVLAISAGHSHTCAALTAGGVKCWGHNAFGQLGTTDTTNRETPADVQDPDLGTVTAVAAGTTHTCALLSDNRVKCWGSNAAGELGDGTSTRRNVPVYVKGLSGAAAVAAGTNASCAQLKDGSVRCWGSDFAGGLGNGTDGASGVPVAVKNISTASTVGLGSNYGCAALASGGVQCWGYNRYGQLGNPSSKLENKDAPVEVFGF